MKKQAMGLELVIPIFFSLCGLRIFFFSFCPLLKNKESLHAGLHRELETVFLFGVELLHYTNGFKVQKLKNTLLGCLFGKNS